MEMWNRNLIPDFHLKKDAPAALKRGQTSALRRVPVQHGLECDVPDLMARQTGRAKPVWNTKHSAVLPVVVVQHGQPIGRRERAAAAMVVKSAKDLHVALAKFSPGVPWVSRAAPLMSWLAGVEGLASTRHRLLLHGSARSPARAFLSAIFEHVPVGYERSRLPPRHQLFDVLASGAPRLVIAGRAARAAKYPCQVAAKPRHASGAF